MKFELDGLVRACCLVKPLHYSQLLESIETLFGTGTLSSIENILSVFSRDNALRLPVDNDDDLNKVIAIAEANQAAKLCFLLIRKKGYGIHSTKSKSNQRDLGSVSDDGQLNEINDTGTDSPPPGTIAPQKRRTTVNTTSKSPISKDGGLFIPEPVRYIYKIIYDFNRFWSRVKMFFQVVVHQSLVENQVVVSLVHDGV